MTLAHDGHPDEETADATEDVDSTRGARPVRREEAYEGRKEIADALGCSERTVLRLATRDYDPLPIRYDFLEREYIYRAALQSWLNRQDLPAHAFHELHRLRRLPQQIRRAGGTTAEGGSSKPRSPVQRARMSKVAKRREHARRYP